MKYKNEWMESLFTETADCSISISKTITQKEWGKIYKDILRLSKKLDFCYVKQFDYKGVKGQCLARSVEDVENYFGTITTKLRLEGLYSQRLAIGPVSFNPKLEEYSCEKETGSAFLGYAYEDHTLSITELGYELENETYIINILAIAFFMESRLPEKIFVYGEFPYEYAQEAINKINKYLKNPIGLPMVCRAKDLLQQIQQTNLSDKERFKLFCDTYRGKYNEECFKLLHDNFSDDIIKEYLEENEKKDSEQNQDSQENFSDDEEETESDEDKIDYQYDIELSSQLFSFKKGNSINPKLFKDIITVLNNIEPAKEQKGYKALSQDSPLVQIRKLAAFKEGLALLDTDWKHIIHCFKTQKNALERYYPLFMISCDTYGVTANITRALMVNDALYKYCCAMKREHQ